MSSEDTQEETSTFEKAHEFTKEELSHSFSLPGNVVPKMDPSCGLFGQTAVKSGLEMMLDAMRSGLKGGHTAVSNYSIQPQNDPIIETIRAGVTRAQDAYDPVFVYHFDLESGHPGDKILLPRGDASRFDDDMAKLIGDLCDVYRDAKKEHAKGKRIHRNRAIDGFERTITNLKLKIDHKALDEQLSLMRKQEDYDITENAISGIRGAKPLRQKAVFRKYEKALALLEEKITDLYANTASLEETARELVEQRISKLIEDKQYIRDSMSLNDGALANYFDRITKQLPIDLAQLTEHDKKKGSSKQKVWQTIPSEQQHIIARYRPNYPFPPNAQLGQVLVPQDYTLEELLGYKRGKLAESEDGLEGVTHSDIRVGLLAHADVLVLDANRIVASEDTMEVFTEVIHAVRSGSYRIKFGENGASQQSPPIDVSAKLLLLGLEANVQKLIEEVDYSDGIFDVQAKVETSVHANEEAVRDFGQYVANRIEDIRPGTRITSEGILALVQYTALETYDRDWLQSDLDELEDFIFDTMVQASRKNSAMRITDAHVHDAMEHRYRRKTQMRSERILEIVEGTRILNVEGTQVGQVNLISTEDSMAIPSSMDAVHTYGVGRIYMVDREIGNTDKDSNKSTIVCEAILKNYFMELGLPTNYDVYVHYDLHTSEVEGPSAGIATLVACLSTLSGVPVKQDFSVTGALTARGNIHSVGSVNEKVKSMYEFPRELFGITSDKKYQGVFKVVVPYVDKQGIFLHGNTLDAIGDTLKVYGVKNWKAAADIMLDGGLTAVEAGLRNGVEVRIKAQSYQPSATPRK